MLCRRRGRRTAVPASGNKEADSLVLAAEDRAIRTLEFAIDRIFLILHRCSSLQSYQTVCLGRRDSVVPVVGVDRRLLFLPQASEKLTRFSAAAYRPTTTLELIIKKIFLILELCSCALIQQTVYFGRRRGVASLVCVGGRLLTLPEARSRLAFPRAATCTLSFRTMHLRVALFKQ